METKHQAIAKIMETMQEPKNIKKLNTRSFKGGFYHNENLNIIESNSYVLDLDEETNVFFTIEPYGTELHTSMRQKNY